MNDKFYTTGLISKERMRLLLKKSNSPALTRFILMYCLFILANLWVFFAWDGPLVVVIISQFFYGILVCSVFACLHETGHGTAFKKKESNRIAAQLVGFAHIYPPSLFRELHFTHHRFTHVPGKDPEISLGNKPAPAILQNLGFYMGWITGFPMFSFKIFMIIAGSLGMPEILRRNLFPFVNPKRRFQVFIESALFLFAYSSIVYLAIFYEPRLLSILIGQIIGHCILAFYLTMEHNGLPHDGTILEKTRSINTNKFVKLIMWNMSYHAEHHAYPAVPFHSLPDLHEALKPEILHKEKGVIAFHRSAIVDWFKKEN